MKKPWYFVMKYAHYRTGDFQGFKAGVVMAETSDEAKARVCEHLDGVQFYAPEVYEVEDMYIDTFDKCAFFW